MIEVFIEDVFEAMQEASDTIDEHAHLWLGASKVRVVEDAGLTVRVHSHYMHIPEEEERERAAGFVALLVGADEVAVV